MLESAELFLCLVTLPGGGGVAGECELVVGGEVPVGGVVVEEE